MVERDIPLQGGIIGWKRLKGVDPGAARCGPNGVTTYLSPNVYNRVTSLHGNRIDILHKDFEQYMPIVGAPANLHGGPIAQAADITAPGQSQMIGERAGPSLDSRNQPAQLRHFQKQDHPRPGVAWRKDSRIFAGLRR
jgi:hypothetical protein